MKRAAERLLGWAPSMLAISICLPSGAAANDGPWFHDVAGDEGVTFRHQDGRSGQKYYVETTASGGGWLDYDGDGDLDLYLVNGAATPGSSLAAKPRNALYENRGDMPSGERFVDVAGRAGVDDDAYGMGLCVGDVDADGLLDFLVTNFGPDRLYRNLGEGRFEEIGSVAGVADSRWSLSCAFGDVDGDGDLDLYVTHYLDFSFERNPMCQSRATDSRIYCRPDDFDGVADSLFLNQGETGAGPVFFGEEGAKRGIAQGTSEKGMGVLLSDLDQDGDLDIYVANDGALNRLYVNDGKGRFEDRALWSGAGLNAVGMPEAGMGIVTGDIDSDGRADLFITHFARETNTLYRQLADLQFNDVTRRAGLGPPSYNYVGWGVGLLDFDNDGDLDLAIANGHMQEGVEKLEPSLSYAQPNQLLENVGSGPGKIRFQEVSANGGEAFTAERVSRALAVGDYNDDGRVDLLVTNTNGGAEVLENRLATDYRWLGLVLKGPPSNPFAIGTRVVLKAGGKRQVREVRSGGGFQSQDDLRVHFGLGDHDRKVELEIYWAGAATAQREITDELDRYWSLSYRAP